MINLPLKPLVCDYYLTFRCLGACEFCATWRDKDLKHTVEAPFETIRQNLLDLPKLGVRRVNFCGGEPLLRNDLLQIVGAAKGLGLETVLSTDGARYADFAAGLAGILDYLYVSIDGPEAAYHDQLRGREVFELARQSVKLARRIGQRVIINFTLTRDNIGFLPEMAELAQALKTLLWINPVYDHFGLQGFEPASLQYIKRYFKHPAAALNLAALEFIKSKGNNVYQGSRCRALQATLTISPDNCLLVPCFFYRKKKIPLKGKLRQIYASEQIKLYQRIQGKDEPCQGCIRWPYMLPSFNYKLDKYFFLNLISDFMFLKKTRSLPDFKRIIRDRFQIIFKGGKL